MKILSWLVFLLLPLSIVRPQSDSAGTKAHPITGKEAFADYSQQKPGTFRRITVADLPQPFATHSVDNQPDEIPRPEHAWPQAPAGFKVELYATGLDYPRLIRTAPNGDLFLAESHLGEIKVFRGVTPDGKAQQSETFATGLRQPFGIAFYPPGPNPQWIYVGNTDSVVRFPYRSGDLKARGPQQKIADLPGGGHLRGGGHWTRDIAFSPDGKKMYVSVGSHSNNDDPDTHPEEKDRADILEFNPDGSGMRIYASGLRNAVGIATQPGTGQLWASTNERDELGDNLPPDYITRVQPGGFYGWPWYYIGPHYDPKHKGKHPELKDKVIVPDVLLQPHFASLEMTFYEGTQFPEEYHGDIFAAEHGSWNRKPRNGYQVIRVPLTNGKPTGEYEDFLTGFVTADGKVWGRPVGVAVGKDGSLFVSDDASRSIWRVTYTGK
jgi:glucose/arabinose dehydrogenase